MTQMKNTHLYDMGAMSYSENLSKRLSDFTRENLYIAIPARIVGTQDYTKLQCLDVQPVFNDVFVKNDSIVQQAITLRKVFVKLPSFGGFSIEFPVKKGDLCTLHWAHKDLGAFLDSVGDENIDQSVFKIANWEDCWIEPGFGTRKTNLSPSKDNFVIKGESTTITITPTGEVTVDTSGTSTITSSGHTINANTTVNGNFTVNGAATVTDDITGQSSITASNTVAAATVSASSGMTVAGQEMKDHVHGGVEPGTGTTGGPQ